MRRNPFQLQRPDEGTVAQVHPGAPPVIQKLGCRRALGSGRDENAASRADPLTRYISGDDGRIRGVVAYRPSQFALAERCGNRGWRTRNADQWTAFGVV